MHRNGHRLEQGVRFEFQVMFDPRDIPIPDRG